jgi:hypothetical protein
VISSGGLPWHLHLVLQPLGMTGYAWMPASAFVNSKSSKMTNAADAMNCTQQHEVCGLISALKQAKCWQGSQIVQHVRRHCSTDSWWQCPGVTSRTFSACSTVAESLRMTTF